MFGSRPKILDHKTIINNKALPIHENLNITNIFNYSINLDMVYHCSLLFLKCKFGNLYPII